MATSIFQQLRISAAIYEHGEEWVLLHGERSVLAFEFEHNKDFLRARYNRRCLARVQRLRKPIRGEHAGYVDLFVPIIAREELVAILVSGPFAIERPTANDILQSWQSLTRRQGHPSDPEFGAYLSAALAVLVLDGKKVAAFEKLIGCLARLMAGEGEADVLMNRIEGLRDELAATRAPERSWELVGEIVDPRSVRSPHSGPRQNDLNHLGLRRVTDHVLVGLTVSRNAQTDAVEETVRRDAFLRAAVELASKVGDVVTGRVGDHGVVFLCGCAGSAQKKRQKARDLAQRAASLARQRFGLSVHFGASTWSESIPLSRSYEAALAAAESALVTGSHWELAELDAQRRPHSLRHLRDELAKTIEEQPHLLRARFDRYLEAVAGEYRYRLDPARSQLELAFERLSQTLLRIGALDGASFRALYEELDRVAQAARTVSELFTAYRRVVADIAETMQHPSAARQDRHLRGAMEYIHRHYAERLRRVTVARVAGFAPGYFSLLFKQREKKTFEEYVQELRVERAKQLLESTKLDAARVGELSGFATPQYFSRSFRRLVGLSPLEYRRRIAGRALRAC